VKLETLRLMREMFGIGRIARVALLPFVLFGMGYLITPAGSNPWVNGTIYASVYVLFLAGIYTYIKLRHGGTFRRFAEAHKHINAMSIDEARAAAEHEIATSGLFRAFLATQSLGGDLPAGVLDFFGKYDRLDLILSDSPSPHLSLCRALLGPVPGNPDALKIGELYPTGSCIAFHLPTERVTGHDPPVRAGTVARCAVLPPARHMSIWHLVALVAEWHRLGERLGYNQFKRRARLNDRPNWRVEPSRT
jgi:hypothetical protein